MRKIITTVLTAAALTLSGCGESQGEYLESKYDELCTNYDLVMCGDKEAPEYIFADRGDLISNGDFSFPSVLEDQDKWDYVDDGTGGDCEDWCITYLERGLRKGYFDNGQARMVYGKKVIGTEYIGHMWLIITVNGEDQIFDNRWISGKSKDSLYESGDYREISTAYVTKGIPNG